ncbi:MAG: hypothetical protein MI745_11770 [Pseudomonadales bacterium]|nr:hypothetical protein [Pseudomonadales bacterium]
MTAYSRLFKDITALLLTIVVAMLLVSGLADNGETLFTAMLAFAAMVPVVASAAVSLKRDWDGLDHHYSH